MQIKRLTRNLFYRYGIAELNISINHSLIRQIYDSLIYTETETSINTDFPEYDDTWIEICLIRDWKTQVQATQVLNLFNQLRSEFNTGIRYMSFYSAKPGLNLRRHRDLTGNLAQGFLRLHIPVITHQDCQYLLGITRNEISFHAESNKIYALDTGLPAWTN